MSEQYKHNMTEGHDPTSCPINWCDLDPEDAFFEDFPGEHPHLSLLDRLDAMVDAEEDAYLDSMQAEYNAREGF